jgi:hypothetical protein
MKKASMLVIAVSVLLCLFGTGCESLPVVPTTLPPITKYVYTDSIGAEMLALDEVKNSRAQGRQWNAMNGATLFYWWSSLAPAINTDPVSITLALGGNDALTCSDPDGWSDNDHFVWTQTLNLIHANTKVIVVLPYATPEVENFCPGSLAAIDEATQDIRDMSAKHDNVTVVDWRPVAETHPTYMCPDSVHLCETQALKDRFDLIVSAGG